LLSIHPKYTEAILTGAKQYEFRRTLFARSVELIVVYATAPVRRIVLQFHVSSLLCAAPNAVWRKCKEYAGMSYREFSDYFEGSPQAVALGIGQIKAFRSAIDPSDYIENFRPPQSFRYLAPDEAQGICSAPELGS
jgi:type I restriction enzyme S subunit